ncbi:glycosyltransferase family 2 protein [Thalassotalea agarivorans]|uniref:Rhamnosyltransferase n=1 Tax=Thalassotalea agarivorans TaxID=349064 RepID=A0A1H9YJW5_THASX|nr:glycosyltransferase family 2 protein [Thalassotalea agarivorans]SES69353.1 rhamnosyltransferase [Thalassotalea agarivorans]
MHKINAIVVTYYPDDSVLKKNMLALSSQVDHVFIIDNTPKGHCFNSDVDLSNISIFKLNENLGIAAAQNVGLKMCLASSIDYCILFDQDSTISPGLINKLYNAITSKEAIDNSVVAVGPRIIDAYTNKWVKPKFQREKKSGSNLMLTQQIIASGKLLRTNALHTIGLMEESLFIDGVDHEWCWRAIGNGCNIAICNDALMVHRLGDGVKSFLGMKYHVGSPKRLYYQYRNYFILSQKKYTPFYWKLRHLFSYSVKIFLFFVFGPDRRLRMKYISNGIKSGLRYKSTE